jgi:hypothetical protein
MTRRGDQRGRVAIVRRARRRLQERQLALQRRGLSKPADAVQPLRVDVHPTNSNVFVFDQRIVTANLVDQR